MTKSKHLAQQNLLDLRGLNLMGSLTVVLDCRGLGFSPMVFSCGVGGVFFF